MKKETVNSTTKDKKIKPETKKTTTIKKTTTTEGNNNRSAGASNTVKSKVGHGLANEGTVGTYESES